MRQTRKQGQEDEKHFTRFITKRCFASVFNGPPASKLSAKVVTPRLPILSVSSSSCGFILVFPAVATAARFSHYFPFSFILPRLLIPRAEKRPSRKETRERVPSFYAIRHTRTRSDISPLHRYVYQRQAHQRKCSICDILQAFTKY